jgi:isochorismate synthase
MSLFAGAGIVAASTPEAELAETAAKARTLLQAMGLER